jgi:hypothetical protein
MTPTMLEKLIQSLTRHREGGEDFDPSVFDDPLALETEWAPAASGGASFRTHRLIQPSANRIEFAPTLGAKAFYLLFLSIGSGLLFFHLNRIRIAQTGFSDQDTLVPLLVGAVFAIVGACLYWFGTTPRVFDQRFAAFWRGRRMPTPMELVAGGDSCAPLSSIHALQLLSEFVSGSKNAYHSYELNLILNGGSRINVVDHGNLERLRGDASKLSQFLDKPVWDATRD